MSNFFFILRLKVTPLPFQMFASFFKWIFISFLIYFISSKIDVLFILAAFRIKLAIFTCK